MRLMQPQGSGPPLLKIRRSWSGAVGSAGRAFRLHGRCGLGWSRWLLMLVRAFISGTPASSVVEANTRFLGDRRHRSTSSAWTSTGVTSMRELAVSTPATFPSKIILAHESAAGRSSRRSASALPFRATMPCRSSFVTIAGEASRRRRGVSPPRRSLLPPSSRGVRSRRPTRSSWARSRSCMPRRNRPSSRVHALSVSTETPIRNGSCNGGSQERVVPDSLVAIP